MSRFQTALLILITIAVLYVAQTVFVPLVLAAFLAMLLAGPVIKLQKWRVPKSAAVIIVVVLAAGLIAGIGTLVFSQVAELAGRIKEYQAEIVYKAGALRGGGGGISETINQFEKMKEAVQTETERETPPQSQPATAPTTAPTTAPATNPSTQPATAPTPAPSIVDRVMNIVKPPDPLKGGPSVADKSHDAAHAVDTASNTPSTRPVVPPDGSKKNPFFAYSLAEPPGPVGSLFEYLGFALGPLGTAGIVLVFVLFMLLEREDLRDRAIRLVSNGQYTITTTAVDDGVTRVMKFMRAQAIVKRHLRHRGGDRTLRHLADRRRQARSVPQLPDLGPAGGAASVRALRGAMGGGGVSDHCIAGGLPWFRRVRGRGDHVRGDRTALQQHHGADALRRHHRPVDHGDPGVGRLLDLALGPCRARAGHAADGGADGARQARAAVAIPRNAAGRQAGHGSARPRLPAPAGLRRSRGV